MVTTNGIRYTITVPECPRCGGGLWIIRSSTETITLLINGAVGYDLECQTCRERIVMKITAEGVMLDLP